MSFIGKVSIQSEREALWLCNILNAVKEIAHTTQIVTAVSTPMHNKRIALLSSYLAKAHLMKYLAYAIEYSSMIKAISRRSMAKPKK